MSSEVAEYIKIGKECVKEIKTTYFFQDVYFEFKYISNDYKAYKGMLDLKTLKASMESSREIRVLPNESKELFESTVYYNLLTYYIVGYLLSNTKK